MASLTARDLLRTALDMEVESADVLAETAASLAERTAWAEHGNRLHVFRLFQYADHVVGDIARDDVEDVLDAAARLDPFERVWVTEGIGYRLRRPPADCGSLPIEALVPLHAGAGLAIASRWLQRVPDFGVAAAVDGVAGESVRASSPGFERVTFESLGLAARTLAPQLVSRFDAAFSQRSAVERSCFWHGFGRGSYFAISNWVDIGTSSARVLDSIRTLASDPRGALSAIAGFIWAVTMVNLRAPEVVEAYVTALLALGCDRCALAGGVECALIVWQHAAPDDDGLDRLLAHRPDRISNPYWSEVVVDAVRSARARRRDVAAAGRVQECFHRACV